MRCGSVVDGRFGKGYSFSSDSRRAENDFWQLKDVLHLVSFPVSNGTFVCWFRLDAGEKPHGAFFSYAGFWQYQWAFSMEENHTSTARNSGCVIPQSMRPTDGDWHHFAATWDAAALIVYLDGQPVAKQGNPELTEMSDIPRRVVRFGTDGDGRPPLNGTMDEIAVIAKTLTADAVRELAQSDKPIRAPGSVNVPYANEFPNAAPPPDKEAFIVNSWGGSVGESVAFRKAIGVNAVNVRVDEVMSARKWAEAGFWLNLRIENSGLWRKYEPAEIAQRVEKLIRPYKDLPNWRLALINSEVYAPSSLADAMTNAAWKAYATQRLGHQPEAALKYAPPSLDYKLLGCEPFSGVLPSDCASLNTLDWYEREGNPVYRVNELTVKAVHRLRPDVMTWSEPSPPAFGLDMLSDWIYDYGTDYCLLRFRQYDGKARAEGVSFMPSLSGTYHHSWTPEGRHPTARDKEGKPQKVHLAQSCDETMIKAWMLLGSTKADAMSYFDAGTWEEGMSNAVAFAADPSKSVSYLAEPDFAERYGRFFRTQFLPVAAKLKGCPAARAKLAYVCTEDCLRTGTQAWRPSHYRAMIGTCLARGPIAFDVLCAKDMTPEVLSQYKYVILPMLGDGISKSHYDALCAVAKTTKVITDTYCTAEFPNVEKLPIKMHYAWSVWKEPPLEDLKPLTDWLAAHTDELRREAFAWSDRDGQDAFTFVKELTDGGKAVMVVNDKREDRSLWPQFCNDPRYRVIAAPNRVVLHLNLPDGEKIETLDLKPAEAKVLYFPQ